MSSNDRSVPRHESQVLTPENIARIAGPLSPTASLYDVPSTLDIAMHPTSYYPYTQPRQRSDTTTNPTHDNPVHPVYNLRHDPSLCPSVREQVSSAAIINSLDSAEEETFRPMPPPFETSNASTNLPVTEIVKFSMNPMNMSFSPFERYRDPDNPSRIKLPIPWLPSSRHVPINSTRYLPRTNITGCVPVPVRLAPISQTISLMATSSTPVTLARFPQTPSSAGVHPLPFETVYNTSHGFAQGSLGPNDQSRNPDEAPGSSMHAQESWIAVAEVPQSQGAFSNAQNFIINNPTFNEIQHQTHDTFMEKFAEHTIRGAAVDSSARDPPPRYPTIFDKAIPIQFNEFITKPFANRRIYRGTQSLIIFIDGIDECDSIPAQCELLELISDFIIQHPSTPLLWITASRPEPRLTGFFDSLDAELYEKTELFIDSDQSRADVEKYLRDSFAKIHSKSHSLRFRRQWPTEHELVKIITAARGLFAYGSTAVRFVDDPKCGSPQSQLQLLLETIDNLPTTQYDELDTDPMALLYALYDRIMSCIPKRTFLDTIKLLYFFGILPGRNCGGYIFDWAAEWLRMTPEVAYGCLHHLHSVLDIPPTLEDAVGGSVEVHHKSFKDYLGKQFPNAEEEFEKVALDAAVSILKEVPPEGSVINSQPWDCLTPFWPHKLQDVKEDLYCHASGTMQSSKLTWSQIISWDSDTIHALRVMTLYRIDWDQLPLERSPATWLTEDVTVVHVLKGLQIFQHAQVGNLDLDRIWESRENFHILYLSKYPSQVSPRMQAQIVCDDYRNHKWSTSVKKGNHHLTMRTISDGICRCCERIKNDLMNVQANTPDTAVAIWTGGDGWGLVIYDFVDPDNPKIEWRYILPYDPVSVKEL
ncbi:hypothetical protein AN958_06285 [Leucoagaricus sp. SymC.cos]|nr:hypothetical protein AN958_06285 [Leucoagaricus sp. SymC.cos]